MKMTINIFNKGDKCLARQDVVVVKTTNYFRQCCLPKIEGIVCPEQVKQDGFTFCGKINKR